MPKENQDVKLESIAAWLKNGSLNIFGIPFAGKDTQGRKLAESLNAQLLGGGDILRGSIIPERIKKIMASGELIPTDDYLQIVLPYLSQKSFAGRPLILSAVGRWHGEEAGVLEATAAAGHPLLAVIFLQLSEKAVWDRWQAAQADGSRGDRADDDAEALEVRLQEFREKTQPVIDFYRDAGLLITIDGSASSEEVTVEIINKLELFANNR